MSPEGQKLWNWKVGTPGGPRRYALRRLPILPALYAPEFKPLRSDPEVNPYELAQTFTYHEKRTARLFRPIAFIFRVMCIDPHDELTDAWQRARSPPTSRRRRPPCSDDVSAVDYAAASGTHSRRLERRQDQGSAARQGTRRPLPRAIPARRRAGAQRALARAALIPKKHRHPERSGGGPAGGAQSKDHSLFLPMREESPEIVRDPSTALWSLRLPPLRSG